MPKHTILVPLDGSTYAEHALPLALGLAERTGAALELVRVRPYRSMREESEKKPFLDQGPPSMERRYLDDIARQLATITPVNVKVLLGDPAESIVNRAADAGAILIVMCTHARGGAGRLLLGSVADAVVHSAAVPVLLIKPPPTRVTLPSVRQPGRVLIPLDGSPQSEQMVDVALRCLGTPRPAVTLVRVVHPEAALVSATAGHDGRDQNVEGELATQAERLREFHVAAETRLITDRDPAAVILAEADRSGARLIAMTTRARRGASRAVIGSVADAVLRGASCPVLLFRPLS